MRFFYILLIVTISGSKVIAQEFLAGPKASFLLSTARFDIPENKQFFTQKPTPGFQIGGALDWPVYNRLFLYTELQLTYKGKLTKIDGTRIENKSRYLFVEAPVLFRFKSEGGAVPSGVFKWHLDIGPSLSYWMGGKGSLSNGTTDIDYEIKFGEPPPNQSLNEMWISNPNRWQWAFNFGAGIEYPVKERHWFYIDLRASVGQTFLTEFDGGASHPALGFVEDTQVGLIAAILSVNYMFEIDLRRGKKGKSTIKKRKQY